jgi:hypothetical protein
MKRTMCGGFLLASVMAFGGCSGDPTGHIVGTGTTLQTSPSSLFMTQGEEKNVVVSVVDAQGNQQDLTGFSFQAAPGVTVTEDTTYLSTSAGQLGTSRRIFVRGDAATASSVSITANSLTSTVPVKVTPTGTTVALSNAVPAANEPLVITLPAGYKFGAGAGANVAGTPGITTAVAADSTSATVVLPPGTTGPLTVDSVIVDFVPGVLFSLPTTETVTVGPATPLAGTDNPATAPAMPVPAPGATTALYDAPDFAAAGTRFYRFDIAEAGDYTVTLDWTTGSDIDLYLCFDPGCATGNFTAATSAHPESATYTIATAPVTYYLVADDYAGDAAGTLLTLRVDREVPE